MTTTLHLVRHGQATDHGQDDPGLSSLGVEQARAVAARLAGRGANAVLHSPKRRAVETARIIGERLDLPPAVSGLADDRTPFPDDIDHVPAHFHPFLAGVPDDERDAGGRQLDLTLDALSAGGPDDRQLVVVTHNFVIGWFVRRALDAPWWRWLGLNQDNAALTTIAYTPTGARLVAFNDTGHLSPRGRDDRDG